MAIRDINLIPQDIFLKRQGIRHISLWCASFVMLFMVLGATHHYFARIRLAPLRPATSIAGMHTQLGDTIEEIERTRSEFERLGQQEAFIKQLTAYQPLSWMLYELAEAINGQTWLTQLAFQIDSAADADPLLKLTGFAQSNEQLGRFLSSLSSHGLFDAVTLSFANETMWSAPSARQGAAVKVVQFQINCRIPRP